jgi:hypothetical protein
MKATAMETAPVKAATAVESTTAMSAATMPTTAMSAAVSEDRTRPGSRHQNHRHGTTTQPSVLQHRPYLAFISQCQ